MSMRQKFGGAIRRGAGSLIRIGDKLAHESPVGESPIHESTSHPIADLPEELSDVEYARVMGSMQREWIERVTPLGKENYKRLLRTFAKKMAGLGHPEVAKYSWYHTIDLGDGILTPGYYDFRHMLDIHGFPEDMSGMTALDIGSATGFFAFEFESRGADVTSVDLPSIADWDMPRGTDKERTIRELMDQYDERTIEGVTHCHIEGPFQFCHKIRGSKVRRRHARIYDVSPAVLGRDSFDLVFICDVLQHTFSPLAALDAVAPLCSNELILVSMYPVAFENDALMIYAGGCSRSTDNRTWWYPTRRCLEEILLRLGFRKIEVSGSFDGTIQDEIHSGLYRRAVIHALK